MRKKIDNDDAPNIEPSELYDTVASDQPLYKSVFKFNSNVIGMYNRVSIHHQLWKHPKYQVYNHYLSQLELLLNKKTYETFKRCRQN